MTRSPFIRDMLSLARTEAEADEILVEQIGLTETHEKLEFLEELFDLEVVRCGSTQESDATRDNNDYIAMLVHIINEKWR